MILLSGRIAKDAFSSGIGRSFLDLPLDGDGRTVLDAWAAQFDAFARDLALPSLGVSIALDRSAPSPRIGLPASGSHVRFEVVRDATEYRGTAGVVRDMTRAYRPSDRVLVLTASHLLRESLTELFRDLCRADESVGVVPFRGSDLAVAFLLRCGRLADVPEVGFVDLKEQAIPASSGHDAIGVATRSAASALPMRTLGEYVRALRALHAGLEADDPLEETWRPAFRIVEHGAEVAPDAVVHDSVVFAGGRVESGAVVVRSVVGPGGAVGARRRVVDRVVGP